MIARHGTISSVSSFSSLYGMLSGPDTYALFGLMFCNDFVTPTTEISMFLMLGNLLRLGSGISAGFSFVKAALIWLFRIWALDASSASRKPIFLQWYDPWANIPCWFYVFPERLLIILRKGAFTRMHVLQFDDSFRYLGHSPWQQTAWQHIDHPIKVPVQLSKCVLPCQKPWINLSSTPRPLSKWHSVLQHWLWLCCGHAVSHVLQGAGFQVHSSIVLIQYIHHINQ